MNIFRTARNIYTALKDDANAMNDIVVERRELALSIATDPAASTEITSATVNNQTFSATTTMTKLDRLNMLSLIVSMSGQGTEISSQQAPEM